MTRPQFLPGFTEKWHTDTYDAISPTRPELSANGKTIIITGGGTGIGGAIAVAFAQASAKAIGIIGRRENKLLETIDKVRAVGSKTLIKHATADVVNAQELNTAFQQFHQAFGSIDILITNAGTISHAKNILDEDADEWWSGFEVNVKGVFNSYKAFSSIASPNPILLNTSSGIAHMRPMAGFSAYAASKIAAARMVEFLNVENPSLHAVNVQPGIVATDMNEKNNMPSFDTPELPASFYVWLASPEARFLRGKFVWVNWDVDELKARSVEIENSSLLTLVMEGQKYHDEPLFPATPNKA